MGHLSGCHLNPAVSIGLWAGGRFPARDLVPYIIVQVLGGLAGVAVLFFIASGKAGFDVSAGFASNGYGAHLSGSYSIGAAFLCEVVMTFMCLLVIHGSEDYPKKPEFRKKFEPRGVIHSWAHADGTQKIEDTGSLTTKRMETVDDETSDRAVAFIREQQSGEVRFPGFL